MKNDIVVAGVGGQGILSIATIIGHAALGQGLNIKQSEVHGMAQRGGAVVAHIRLSDEIIYSDVIPQGKADVVLSVEPLESVRYVSYLKKSGAIITNNQPLVNINNYPELSDVYAEIEKYKRHVLIDADAMAKEAGSVRAMNMVILGAVSAIVDLPDNCLRDAMIDFFSRKGEKVVEVNKMAFDAGHAAGLKVC